MAWEQILPDKLVFLLFGAFHLLLSVSRKNINKNKKTERKKSPKKVLHPYEKLHLKSCYESACLEL